MNTPSRPSRDPAAPSPRDGFDVLDECHRQTLAALDELAGVVERLADGRADDQARAMARRVVQHFSTTARQHHEDEERHVFPKLSVLADAEMAQVLLRLQQDHRWIEQDWLELEPQLDAVASGQSWYDLDTLRESAQIFSALSFDHIDLEESAIYPQARESAGDRERLAMGREMAARRHARRDVKPA